MVHASIISKISISKVRPRTNSGIHHGKHEAYPGARNATLIRGTPLICLLLWAPLCVLGQNSSSPAQNGQPTKEEPRFLFSPIHVNGPYIAITFDDGPHPELTPKLLDILIAHHVRATFFVVGNRVVKHPEIVARAAREGHEIANHSWSHPRLSELHDQDVRQELQKGEDAIRSVVGIRPKLLRPPGGALLARQEKWIRDEFGYNTILWDVHGFDWIRPPPAPAMICQRIVEQTHPGAVIVCHDTLPGTIEATPSILEQLVAKGFKFVTVSELLQMAANGPHSSSTP